MRRGSGKKKQGALTQKRHVCKREDHLASDRTDPRRHNRLHRVLETGMTSRKLFETTSKRNFPGVTALNCDMHRLGTISLATRLTETTNTRLHRVLGVSAQLRSHPATSLRPREKEVSRVSPFQPSHFASRTQDSTWECKSRKQFHWRHD